MPFVARRGVACWFLFETWTGKGPASSLNGPTSDTILAGSLAAAAVVSLREMHRRPEEALGGPLEVGRQRKAGPREGRSS
jgi:hypothetical protein